MPRDQLLILIIIIVVFIVFVVALCLSFQVAHHVRNENARLTDLVRNHEQRLQALTPPPQDAGASVSQPDDSLMEWIDERMDQARLYLQKDLDLKTAAREFGLTQKRISEALKQDERYGSFAEYLTCKRIAYACQLLQHKPYYCIDSIASDAGFRARKTFQTVFKARLGMTPSQYRERCALSGGKEA